MVGFRLHILPTHSFSRIFNITFCFDHDRIKEENTFSDYGKFLFVLIFYVVALCGRCGLLLIKKYMNSSASPVFILVKNNFNSNRIIERWIDFQYFDLFTYIESLDVVHKQWPSVKHENEIKSICRVIKEINATFRATSQRFMCRIGEKSKTFMFEIFRMNKTKCAELIFHHLQWVVCEFASGGVHI